MTRTQRLPFFIDLLRKGPVNSAGFGMHFGEGTKTFYADIQYLRNQGHPIESTSDGFVLRTVSASSPTFFTDEELQAILTGLAWVAADENTTLSDFAATAVTKVESLLPARPSLSGPLLHADNPTEIVRAAIDRECRLELVYRDGKGSVSNRIIWPLEMDAYDETAIISAWCEQRSDFRNFRLDRIQSLTSLDRYPARRQTLLAKFELQQKDNGW